MQALKCDLCGSFYELYNTKCSFDGKYNGFKFVKTVNKYCDEVSDIYDLCPDCMNALRKFINKRKRKE